MNDASTIARPAASRAVPAAVERPRVWHRPNPTTIVVLAVAIALVVLAALTTPEFATSSNIRAMLRDAAYTGIIAVAMTPMTLSGNLVSLGIAQSAVGAAMLFAAFAGGGMAWPLAALLMLVLMLALGIVQGLIVAAGLNPVITTLAAGSVVYGYLAYRSNGGAVTLPNAAPLHWANSRVLGIPFEVLVFAVITVVITVIYGRTIIGRQTTLVGANRQTAALSGISYGRVTVIAFGVFSLGVAVVGLLYTAGFGQANPQSLSAMAIDPIAALLIGGTAINGGHGAPWRSAAGALFISMVDSFLVLRGLDPGQVQAVEGAIVVAVVIVLVVLNRKGSNR